jgi:hypothetical protein
MSSNRLSGPIPTTFANLVNITRINLHSNLLTGTLEPFVSLRTMDFLNIGDNRISGEFAAGLRASGPTTYIILCVLFEFLRGLQNVKIGKP